MTRNYAVLALATLILMGCQQGHQADTETLPQDTVAREKVRLNQGWRFFKYAENQQVDPLIYDIRPDFEDDEDGKAADAKPTEAVELLGNQFVLKPWILPTANPFIRDPQKHHVRPQGNPGADFAFVQDDFDDSDWQLVSLPHDWAIKEPFYVGEDVPVGGGMGRLPSPGVAWYRQSFDLSDSDIGKSVYLDIDGAMSYAMVWLNGNLVGGWPYGYNSFRLDLTPYLRYETSNTLAIRLDNPPASSRWYPGGGLYRDVWLVKTNAVHVAHWGTHITTKNVSVEQATVDVEVTLQNDADNTANVMLRTDIYEVDQQGQEVGLLIQSMPEKQVELTPGSQQRHLASVQISNPKLWGPLPTQTPHRYLARTTISQGDQRLDEYDTLFGIRDLQFDPVKGVLVNGESIYLQGVNQHHDLGPLGAAFNKKAARRQLELLREMGVNAIRLAHNPPAKGLLELTDEMGFLVVDEIFDVWERKKTPLDFHLIFPEWHEADLRSFLRRDRNHPSVIMWSIGNEVGEQYTDVAGAQLGQRLHDIVKQEDPTGRPTAASMNFAKPDMPFSAVMDSISLNYQGEGIRDAPAYSMLKGIRTSPLYPKFQKQYPNKLIFSSENAAAVSSRGEYLFPVEQGISAPVMDGQGGDPKNMHVSAYELYTAPFGSSADKVLRSLEEHPYVAGGFVWSGWDYLGEPTPYYGARSSYFGVIDLAGFKKDRFYLYQAHWRPDYPMVHILPHWNWTGREGQVTPVHVFTSGDEAELFVNGESLGRQKKAPFTYRLRWDDVRYQAGEIKVVAYKHGKRWAEESIETTSSPAALSLEADNQRILADGEDLIFVTVKVLDEEGRMVPNADNMLEFSLSGPGEIMATDNGDPTNLVAFSALQKSAFNGLCLAIIKANDGAQGELKLTVSSDGLSSGKIAIAIQK